MLNLAPQRLPVADLFQALADPSRLRILALAPVDGIVGRRTGAGAGQSQPRVSRHVKILADSG